MRAICYDAFAGPLTIRTVDDPVAPDDGVVIRVAATGICRSDWHGWQGHDPDITSFPHVPGHEFAGTIASVGRDVRGWQIGQRVTAPFVCGCGECTPCLRGNQQVCLHQTQPGFTHWGSFAELVMIRHAATNLVALPDAISMTTAAALGCRFATSFRAIVEQGRVREDQWVAVHGAGGVGLSAVMIAAALGARVIAVDIDPVALARAHDVGAELLVRADQVDVVETIRDLTSGGADVSLDTLGSTVTAVNSVACLRVQGRHVQVGLLAGADRRPPMPMELVIARELELVGSHGMAAHNYPAMLAMIADGRLAPDRLVARTVTLEQAPAELVALGERGAGGMVVVAMNDER